MNHEESYPEKAANLNEYLETLEERASDLILLVATSGDVSENFKNINFEPCVDYTVKEPEPGEVLVAIIDGSEKKSIQKQGKNVSVDYEWNGYEFGAHSKGLTDDSEGSYVYFTIDRSEIRPENEGELKILLFSKSENQILNLFSVDTHTNLVPIIEKADVDVFNLERRLYLSGLSDIVDYDPMDNGKDISEAANFMRRVSYHISELLNNPDRLMLYAKARIASFYADRKFLDPDYPAALKWINGAIVSSSIDDDELMDDASVYYAVNQFMLNRDLSETVSEKNLYFLNMSPVGGNLRLLQISTVILLKILDEICKKHNLEYWAIAGTLLGAVRHKGFIPWDDDVDVGMLRSDIYKLEKIIKDEYPDIRFKKDVVVVKHDAYRHYEMSLKDYGPVFIDIFIFDVYDVPVETLEERIGFYNRKICQYADYYKRKNNINEDGPLNDLQKADIDNVLSVFSGEKETLHVVNGRSIGYGADTMMPLLAKVRAYETGTVFPCKTAMFENIEIKIPSDYHLFLKGYFGNYHTTPFNAFIKKHTELSDENICNLKIMISKYSQYLLETNTNLD